MKKLLLISSSALLLLISCVKEKLPKLTEEGKNTFGYSKWKKLGAS